MEYFLRWAASGLGIVFLLLVAVVVVLRLKVYKGVRYRYPLTTTLSEAGTASRHPYAYILYVLRLLSLVTLALALGRPQLVDPRSLVPVEGIDIMLVLDVSESMKLPHHMEDMRTRIAVAKEEALHFVDKRPNDAIGLVIFGADALSRCPLTADKRMLKEIITQTDIGSIDGRGTVLATGILTALNRLKHSSAKSKIMIVLTDGEPTEQDSDPRVAVKIAKQLGIKIYTVGIGSEGDLEIPDPFYGMIRVQTMFNKPLLTMIAQETGGRFFEAKKPQDMRTIYDTINALETTSMQAPVFGVYYDLFMYALWFVFLLMLLELFLSCCVWFSL